MVGGADPVPAHVAAVALALPHARAAGRVVGLTLALVATAGVSASIASRVRGAGVAIGTPGGRARVVRIRNRTIARAPGVLGGVLPATAAVLDSGCADGGVRVACEPEQPQQHEPRVEISADNRPTTPHVHR